MGQKSSLAIALISLLGILPAFSLPAFSLEATANEVSSSQVLATIAQNSGLVSPTITVCNLFGKCLSYQSDRPPQSAASLIKVPIAIVLLHKLATENVSLDTPVYVDPSNFTEDDFSNIKVGQSYSLRYLLAQMIAYSSNVATNQIIDYLGWDYLKQTLGTLGYSTTRVSHKLTGAATHPRKNIGWAPNRITSHELTDMMVQIYNHQHPEYDVMIDILNHQVDRDLGFQSLKESLGHWLGEKTGDNSLVRGTTLAVDIQDKTYIITVTEDVGKSDRKIRRCIAQIVDYIASNGGF